MPTLSGSAPAKINLGLRILERRSDGYHELRTVFQTISLADRLTVGYTRRGKGQVSLDCDIPEFAGSDNLAARAARTLLDAGKYPGRVRITLEKRIPAGAGLGGGSSDAAAVLSALRLLLRPQPSTQLLYEIAARIGSDAPFFLLGGTAVGIGRGEEIYPLPDPPRRWLLLLVPESRISTPDAYRRLAESRSKRGSELTAARRQHIISGFRANIFGPEGVLASSVAELPPNDFEAVIFETHPELRKWKQRLLRLGASAAFLSGSGSALFGVFGARKAALEARKSLGAFPGNAYVAKTLDRRTYRSIWRRDG